VKIFNFTAVNTFHIVVSVYKIQQSQQMVTKLKTAKRANELMFLWAKHARSHKIDNEQTLPLISKKLSFNLISTETFFQWMNDTRTVII
jgi:hypothetical protein